MWFLDLFIHFCEAIPTLPYGRCVHSLTLNAEILEASLIAFPKYMNVPIWMHSAHIYALTDICIMSFLLYPLLSHSLMQCSPTYMQTCMKMHSYRILLLFNVMKSENSHWRTWSPTYSCCHGSLLGVFLLEQSRGAVLVP